MFLEEILTGNVFESRETECKQILNRDNIEGWIKTIAGFANADGGTMYIGVDDKTNQLIGFERKQADNERNYFNNQINEHISPRPPYKVDFISYKIRGKERFIIAVKVEKSPVRPVIVKFNNIPSIYMRREGFTNGATYEEIIEMSIKSQDKSFDTLISDKIYKRDDFSKLFKDAERFLEYVIKNLRSTNMTLLYSAKDEEHNNALVLKDWLNLSRNVGSSLVNYIHDHNVFIYMIIM